MLMVKLAQVGKKHTPETLAASRRFDGFKTETENAVRKAKEMKTDQTIERMKKAFAQCRLTGDRQAAGYDKVDFCTRNLMFRAKDLETFSIAMADLQDDIDFLRKAGFFLSALINQSDDKEFVIHTSHLSRPIDSLGYCNKKIVIVNGDVGDLVGAHMRAGTILVEGNASDSAGSYMKGGSLDIKGNARNWLGSWMEGGLITVGHDAGKGVGGNLTGGSIFVNGKTLQEIGYEMKGGTIQINGKVGGVSAGFEHGKIFNKDKLIFDK